MSHLEIYVMNVGQADTAVIRTPQGNVIIIDAFKPAKLRALLKSIGVPEQGRISHLVITHPHEDHYLAAQSLLQNYAIQKVTLSPSWHQKSLPNGYSTILNMLDDRRDTTSVRFLSGYERLYPDELGHATDEENPCLELLGPSNQVLRELAENKKLDTNHLSIIARLSYQKFSMVFAGDAQMENWAHYDREGMLSRSCRVLKAAHHGSKNGTQWERIDQLSPTIVIVSSDPEKRDHLPDLISSAVFMKYDSTSRYRHVLLTKDTGSIKLVVDKPASGGFKRYCFREVYKQSNPWEEQPKRLLYTKWGDMVRKKTDEVLAGPG